MGRVLTVDIGNTNLVAACWDGENVDRPAEKEHVQQSLEQSGLDAENITPPAEMGQMRQSLGHNCMEAGNIVRVGKTDCSAEKAAVRRGAMPVWLVRAETGRKWTAERIRSWLLDACSREDMEQTEFDGAILSSVVPTLSNICASALQEITGKPAVLMDRTRATGIRIGSYDADAVGIDRLVDLAAAAHFYGTPVAVYDLGTCTTLSVVDDTCTFVGGMISPGIQLSLTAMAEHTAALPQLIAKGTDVLLGNDTASCMYSGTAAAAGIMIDGVLTALRKDYGQSMKAVVTGGLGELVLPWITGDVAFDPDLQLKGLLAIFRQEEKRGNV